MKKNKEKNRMSNSRRVQRRRTQMLTLWVIFWVVNTEEYISIFSKWLTDSCVFGAFHIKIFVKSPFDFKHDHDQTNTKAERIE